MLRRWLRPDTGAREGTWWRARRRCRNPCMTSLVRVGRISTGPSDVARSTLTRVKAALGSPAPPHPHPAHDSSALGLVVFLEQPHPLVKGAIHVSPMTGRRRTVATRSVDVGNLAASAV